MQNEAFNLSDEEKIQLLDIARCTINDYLLLGKVPKLNKEDLSNSLQINCGAFVSLHKHGLLRGCIGRFLANEPLYKIVQEMAASAATKDSRFDVLSIDELNEIEIEISVLTPLKKIESIDEIDMGKHGIYIKKGEATGTFLPQVAIETGWTKEEYLGYCSKNKAGLGWNGWKDAEISTFEALVFGEHKTKNI